MSEQIFISYRRDGGDIYAKAICDALKVRGYSVFYDFDSLQGGYFDSRIITAIEECNDFVLVLPQGSLDRCQNDDDWVRLEIRHALECGKNIIPVMLPGFSFPKNLPDDISAISRLNGIDFVMGYFDLAVIPTIVSRLISAAGDSAENGNENKQESEGSQRLEYKLTLNDDEYEVSLGRCTDEIITIPASFKGKPVTSIAEGGFKNYRSLKAITIPESVTIIGAQAFFGCTALTSITIPQGVTTIEKETFQYCSSLESVAIPTSVKSINQYAFFACNSLTSIVIPEGVTIIEDNVFHGCGKLASVVLPKGITYIRDHTFCECPSLTSVNIPDGVTGIGTMAFICCSFTSIIIPDGVIGIGDYAFSSCLNLTSVTLPDSVKRINDCAFANCRALTSITIPSEITSISGNVLKGCESLTNIIFKGTKKQWKAVKSFRGWKFGHTVTVNCTDAQIKMK